MMALLADPNIAYLLILMAIYGLFFEFSTPRLVLRGAIGVIALLIALYAFRGMPINYTGLTLILIGIALMVCEMYTACFGLFVISGLIAFTIGSMTLFNHLYVHTQIAWQLIGAMSIFTMSFLMMVTTLAIQTYQKNQKKQAI